MAVATNASDEPATERAYRRGVFAWSLYDWADHAFITSTAATFFPPYFVAIAAPVFLEASKAASDPAAQARDTASNVYALAISLALFIAAILAPIIGTYADITGQRKRQLIIVTIIAGILSSAMFVITTGTWLIGIVLYMAAQVALNIALGLNSSLLPHVARPDDMNRASSLGYAMGYIGGAVLLTVNTALYLFSDKLGIDSGTAIRIVFLLVGLWWIGFMIPMALNVPEPAATPLAHGSKGSAVRDAFTRIGNTVRDIRRYRELFKMLVAFWLYSEGIGTIILLASAYGAALGFTTATLITALLMTQFVAFPYAIIYGRIADKESKWRSVFLSMLLWTAVTFPLMGLFANRNPELTIPTTFGLIFVDQIIGAAFSYFIGRNLFAGLAQRLDAKRAVILGLVIYTIIPVWGFFLNSQAEFFMIGWMVGTVQGGTQALSRSIYVSLSPRAKSGEFFGLYGLSEKFAGILGPLLYGVIGTITHDPRSSVLSISVFFLIGIYALWRVNVAEGAKVAAEEEAAIEQVHAAD